jgi:peptidoglycan/xylan/chitin deacetylase (PgdA/CDA1 family)
MNLYTENSFQRFLGVSSNFALPSDILKGQVNLLFTGLFTKELFEWEMVLAQVLGEEQFGRDHFRLKGLQRLYYQVRSFLPIWVRPLLHQIAGNRQVKDKLLGWPVEDRWVRFLFRTLKAVLQNQQESRSEYLHFWPYGKRFAFVITHDIESAAGQAFVRNLADLDEKHGFRSAFNFVPKGYTIDYALMNELKERGFEVGVHGLKHDGRLFSSRAIFEKRAHQINHFMHEFEAKGFRSPLTHRNPEWMQSLNIEYDSSFFDSDPFEPISGGTMSIWPFQMGRFVELPYTLVQDHTLMSTLGEKTPKIWLEKVDFIRNYCGMALINVHPDYQRNPEYFAIYEEFLWQMRQENGYWHALPKELAAWWKKRSAINLDGSVNDIQTRLPGATFGKIGVTKENNLEFELENDRFEIVI